MLALLPKDDGHLTKSTDQAVGYSFIHLVGRGIIDLVGRGIIRLVRYRLIHLARCSLVHLVRYRLINLAGGRLSHVVRDSSAHLAVVVGEVDIDLCRCKVLWYWFFESWIQSRSGF